MSHGKWPKKALEEGDIAMGNDPFLEHEQCSKALLVDDEFGDLKKPFIYWGFDRNPIYWGF